MIIIIGNALTIRAIAIGMIAVTAVVHLLTLALDNDRKANAIRLLVYGVMLTTILLSPTNMHSYGNTNWVVGVNGEYMTRHFVYNILLLVYFSYTMYLTVGKHWCILVLLMYVLSVEFLQIFVVGRVCDINDIIANSIGVAIGYGVALVVKWRMRDEVQDQWSM